MNDTTRLTVLVTIAEVQHSWSANELATETFDVSANLETLARIASTIGATVQIMAAAAVDKARAVVAASEAGEQDQ